MGDKTRMLVCSLPLTHITAAGLFMVYNVIRWSMDCLQRSEWPNTAHDGACVDGRRAKFAGTPLCRGPHTCILAEIVGDWKWVWETLQLKWYWGVQLCCHWVTCALAISAMMRRTHDEYLDTFEDRSQVPPLMLIDGMRIERVMHDFMHGRAGDRSAAGWIVGHRTFWRGIFWSWRWHVLIASATPVEGCMVEF